MAHVHLDLIGFSVLLHVWAHPMVIESSLKGRPESPSAHTQLVNTFFHASNDLLSPRDCVQKPLQLMTPKGPMCYLGI